MKNKHKLTSAICIALAAAFTLSCTAPRAPEQTLYDFGPLPAQSVGAKNTLPPLSVADVKAPAWLDSNRMMYRLAYANEQQLRSYAQSKWSMPPARLFEQRLKARIAQNGSSVLSTTDGAANLPLLRIDAEDFTQIFDSATHSVAQVSVRVSLMRGRKLLAQKTFVHQSPAPSADATGGAVAAVVASDAVITDMLTWLASQALN